MVAFVAVPALVGAVLVATAGPWPVVFAGCGYLLALVGLAVAAPADGPDDRDVGATPLVPMERAAVREWVTLRWPLDAYDSLDHAAVRASEELGFVVTTDELCDAAIVAVPRTGWRLRGADYAERRKPLSIYA